MMLKDLEHPVFSGNILVKIDEKSVEVNKVSFAVRKNIGGLVFENNTETNIIATFKDIDAVDVLINGLMALRYDMVKENQSCDSEKNQ